MASGFASNDLQVKDVYDFAYEIAEEFNKIIHLLDIEEATPLINKVINVLELLEESVRKIENLEKENTELKAKHLKMSCEKVANDEEKLSLKQAFEELEESWSQESEKMISLVKKLRADNKLLQNNLSEKKEVGIETSDSCTSVIEEQNNFILKLKHQLKQKNRQEEKNQEAVETLSSKVEHLMVQNKTLHLQYLEVRDKATTSLIEKRDCEATIHLQQKKIDLLENSVGIFRKILNEEKECHPSSKGFQLEKEHSFYEDNLKCLLEEQMELRQCVSNLQQELSLIKSQTEEYKRLLKVVNRSQNPSCKGGRIQQIFRLFLGVFNVGTRICWFR